MSNRRDGGCIPKEKERVMRDREKSQDPVAALQAECDVLRVLLACLVRDVLDRDIGHFRDIGVEQWSSPALLSLVSTLSGKGETPEQAQHRQRAFSRFTSAIQYVASVDAAPQQQRRRDS